MAKHSPLPWRSNNEMIEGPYPSHRFIADFKSGPDEEDEANAEFACRAVNSHADLLAALDECAMRLSKIAESTNGHPVDADRRDRIHGHASYGLAAVRAALAKARGEGEGK